jgi:hypothetical protein
MWKKKLALGFAKRDFKSAKGNGKIPSEKICIGLRKYCYNRHRWE